MAWVHRILELENWSYLRRSGIWSSSLNEDRQMKLTDSGYC